MIKLEFRAMTVRELRHFLARFDPDERLNLRFLGSPPTVTVDNAPSVHEVLEASREQDDDDPVEFASSLGIHGVWGVVSSRPPVLYFGLTSDSIQNN